MKKLALWLGGVIVVISIFDSIGSGSANPAPSTSAVWSQTPAQAAAHVQDSINASRAARTGEIKRLTSSYCQEGDKRAQRIAKAHPD